MLGKVILGKCAGSVPVGSQEPQSLQSKDSQLVVGSC